MSERSGVVPCPEMRSPAAGNGRANRNIGKHHASNLADSVVEQQAHRLVRLYSLSYAVAVTVAQLTASGCGALSWWSSDARDDRLPLRSLTRFVAVATEWFDREC